MPSKPKSSCPDYCDTGIKRIVRYKFLKIDVPTLLREISSISPPNIEGSWESPNGCQKVSIGLVYPKFGRPVLHRPGRDIFPRPKHPIYSSSRFTLIPNNRYVNGPGTRAQLSHKLHSRRFEPSQRVDAIIKHVCFRASDIQCFEYIFLCDFVVVVPIIPSIRKNSYSGARQHLNNRFGRQIYRYVCHRRVSQKDFYVIRFEN